MEFRNKQNSQRQKINQEYLQKEVRQVSSQVNEVMEELEMQTGQIDINQSLMIDLLALGRDTLSNRQQEAFSLAEENLI